MIFPTDDVLDLRGRLEDRVIEGEISEAEAFREALAADPDDPRAIRLLALLAEEEGDFATAESLAWRWLHADPLSHEVFRLIGRLLTRDPNNAGRAAAYTALGNEKLHFDPEAESDGAPSLPSRGEGETEEVAYEMEPHRLLHTMWTASTGEVDRSVVDRAIARGQDMAPLLHGILNLFGEDLLDDVDDALVIRSLALLGEIGDPSALRAITEFVVLEDETFSDPAAWAFQRISFEHPAETLREINRLIPIGRSIELFGLTQHVTLMPDIPGRIEALGAILERAREFEADEAVSLAVAAIAGAMVIQGARGTAATQWMEKYGDLLNAHGRRQLKSLSQEVSITGPLVTEPEATTVYDLCCPGFDAAEEDEPFVRSEPKIGRNDPCWCGSGKKYKKCHLAADEGHQ